MIFCEFDKQLAGPIHDEQCVEQGGIPSSDLYNEFLKKVQSSKNGVDMGSSLLVSGMGQADDTALL